MSQKNRGSTRPRAPRGLAKRTEEIKFSYRGHIRSKAIAIAMARPHLLCGLILLALVLCVTAIEPSEPHSHGVLTNYGLMFVCDLTLAHTGG